MKVPLNIANTTVFNIILDHILVTFSILFGAQRV